MYVSSTNKYFIFIVIPFVFTNILRSQSYHIRLDSLTALDDPSINVEIMSPSPAKPVKLPPGESENRRFISEFYSRQMTDHPDFVIMVVSKADGDLLYIDKNLDDDLTNDGPPVFFPFNQDTLTFEIVAPRDSNQRVRLLLARKPDYHRSSDSSKSNYVDELGNLNPRFAKFVGSLKGEPDFKGSYGSFYFDDRVTVRRGSLSLDGNNYAIGLFDFGNNGLYNDADDVLIVDTSRKGYLGYLDRTKVFKLGDVFSLAGHNFKIHDLDKYGTWVDLEETSQPATSYFILEQDSIHAASARKTHINPDIWNLTDTTLSGSIQSLRDYKGKYLLLNFWGEWCKPCLEEIPALKRAWRKHSEYNIQFISFIRTQSTSKAKQLVADSNITWPQIRLSDKLERQSRVRWYPTNILIFPNGTDCLIIDSVNDDFFEKNLR